MAHSNALRQQVILFGQPPDDLGHAAALPRSAKSKARSTAANLVMLAF
jgi:hypothetical protein